MLHVTMFRCVADCLGQHCSRTTRLSLVLLEMLPVFRIVLAFDVTTALNFKESSQRENIITISKPPGVFFRANFVRFNRGTWNEMS